MRKISKQIIIFIMFSCILLISLAGCNNRKDSSEAMLEKIDQEIFKMANMLNHIPNENYKVSSKQINNQDSSSSSSQAGGNSNGSEGQGNSETDSSNGGSQSSKESTSSPSKEGGASQTQTISEMMPNGVLGRKADAPPDWNTLQVCIENLYESWSTIILDLYKINVNNNSILEFSKQLDMVAKSMKQQDKTKTVTELANLYHYIPQYVKEYSKDSQKKQVFLTKGHIINSYAYVDQGDWTKVAEELKAAENEFMGMINDISAHPEKQYEMNKTYVLLKEFQNTIEQKEPDLYYIKYRNVLSELNTL